MLALGCTRQRGIVEVVSVSVDQLFSDSELNDERVILSELIGFVSTNQVIKVELTDRPGDLIQVVD